MLKLTEPPPRDLIDPEGEGVYLLADWEWENHYPSIYREAARRLGVTDDRGRLNWRALDVEYVWMEPRDDGLWWRASLGRFPLPRAWRLNLPRSRRPVMYAYCCPPAG